MTNEKRITSATGGAKGDKLARFDQIPAGPMLELAYRYGLGSTKYPAVNGLDNWRNGYAFSLSIAALERHINAFKRGEDYDDSIYREAGLLEDGEHPLYDEDGKLRPGVSHMAAAAWHCFFLMHHLVEHPELDDRPTTVEKRNAEAAEAKKVEANRVTLHFDGSKASPEYIAAVYGRPSRYVSTAMAESIQPFLDVIEENIAELAKTTNTPPHFLTGDPVVCQHCGGGITDHGVTTDWYSTGHFGGTGAQAYYERAWCADAPDHKHSPREWDQAWSEGDNMFFPGPPTEPGGERGARPLAGWVDVGYANDRAETPPPAFVDEGAIARKRHQDALNDWHNRPVSEPLAGLPTQDVATYWRGKHARTEVQAKTAHQMLLDEISVDHRNERLSKQVADLVDRAVAGTVWVKPLDDLKAPPQGAVGLFQFATDSWKDSASWLHENSPKEPLDEGC